MPLIDRHGGAARRTLCSPQAMGLENGNLCPARSDTELWRLGFVRELFQPTLPAVIHVDTGWYLHPEPNLEVVHESP